MWPPTSLPLKAFFWVQRKKTFKPPYLKITFGTNVTFLQKTAELIANLDCVTVKNTLAFFELKIWSGLG